LLEQVARCLPILLRVIRKPHSYANGDLYDAQIIHGNNSLFYSFFQVYRNIRTPRHLMKCLLTTFVNTANNPEKIEFRAAKKRFHNETSPSSLCVIEIYMRTVDEGGI
ncbi:hypothetical protein IscW_ISCW009573, partial [Ixodes scapularis]